MLAAVVCVMTMITQWLEVQDAGAMEHALAVLESGGLVAFPTDTVYGLGAYPWDEEAVGRLYRVKERSKELPIPLLLSDAGEVDRVAVLPERCRDLSARFWPGGLTLVLRKKDVVSGAISERPTVAVRVPDLPVARDLIRDAGGVLAVTSANISGMPSPITAREVEAQLGGRIGMILNGGPCSGGVPSTVLDCSISPPRVLRCGAVSEADLSAVIGALEV